MFRFVCLALIIALTKAKITYKDCGHGEVKDAQVSSCAFSPCTLHKGKNVTIPIIFEANQYSKTVKVKLYAILDDFPIEFKVNGIESDGCKFMKCPITKGETTIINYVITISKDAFSADADIKVKLLDDNGGILACVNTHGSIKN